MGLWSEADEVTALTAISDMIGALELLSVWLNKMSPADFYW